MYHLTLPCIGVNCYFGNHHSKWLKNRPETIDGKQNNDYYARKNSKCKENILLIDKFIEYKTKLTKQKITTMNDHYMRFVGYNTCNRLIWKNGMNGSKRECTKTSNKH